MLEFLVGLLAFGTLWFWLFSFVVFCAITALVENDEGVWATLVFIGTVLSLNFLSKVPLLDYIKLNPGHTLMYIGIYFAAGIGWSFIKWGVFLKKRNLKYEAFKAKYMRDNKIEGGMTPEQMSKFFSWLGSNYEARDGKVAAAAPEPSDHKRDITRWSCYWPFSFVGTLLNDVVRRSWDFIYEVLQSTYQRMSYAIFKGAREDAKAVEQYKAEQAAAGAGDSGSRRNRGY